MKNGIQMVGTNRAQINLRAQIQPERDGGASEKALQNASLSFWESNHGKTNDTVQVPDPQKLVLTEDRYVMREFRALSQVFLENRGLDFSRDGVLKAAVGLMLGIPIFANHDFRDIDNARGVIADAYWDAKGEFSEGVPGINVNCKVDAFLNYRTACNLMSKPPVINCASVTVLSEVEFSHPELVKDGTFWNRFGEECDGEIVRLIATKIIDFWEMSFVFKGEDRLAKGMPATDESEDDESTQTEARKKKKSTMSATKLNATEKTTMKIENDIKTLLGITADGDDVPEQTVLDAAIALAKANKYSPNEIADLSVKATQGEKLLATKRDEVKRLAALTEFGADEGTLNSVVVKMIDNADAEELVSLETDYRKKIGDKFPANGQSSLENNEEIETAGGLKKTEAETVKPTKLL